jgi:hypothetical protein
MSVTAAVEEGRTRAIVVCSGATTQRVPKRRDRASKASV